MSGTESEYETQPVGIASSEDSQQVTESTRLHEQLISKGDQFDSSQVDTIGSAIQTLDQSIRPCDLEDDNALNSRLAKAAQTVIDFLKLAESTISTQVNYDMLPLCMRGQLVQYLDLILCEEFLQTLFHLRQMIRSMAIRREHVVSCQMATLPDVVIAAIIDYVSVGGSCEESLKGETATVKEYSTIELTVRLPHRIDSLEHFLTIPIPEADQDLELQLKLRALALLYCSHCLNPSSNKRSGKNVADGLSGFWLYVPFEKFPHYAIAHMLCVYMSSHSTLNDGLHPFRPATNATIWALLLKLFPDPGGLFREELSPPQRMLFSHGALVMPWIWHNKAFCSSEQSDWVDRITLMWLHQSYLVFSLCFIKHESVSFEDIFYGFERFQKTSDFTIVKETLLGNNQKGLNLLLVQF